MTHRHRDEAYRWGVDPGAESSENPHEHLGWRRRRGALQGDGDFSERYRDQGDDWRTGGRGDRDFRGRGPRGYQKRRIHQEVCQRMTEDPRLDASQLEVHVDDEGLVRLEGHVDSRASKRHAERICDQIQGVRDVRNELEIDSDRFDRRGHLNARLATRPQ